MSCTCLAVVVTKDICGRAALIARKSFMYGV